MMTEAELAPQTLDTATALPAHCYVDPAAVELDRIAVFARSWQLVARADALSGAGDHVVCEIAGVPLLLVRGTDGTLRALHNVCRHRAGPLALCDGRGARRFACRYHGWTYALDGRLLSAPEMTDTEEFDVAKVRLPEAQVGEWQGLVFAALGNVPPLVEVLDGIAERCAAQGKAVVIVTHDLAEVERLCELVGIVRRGHLVAEETIAGLKRFQRRRAVIAFDGPIPVEAIRAVPGVVDLSIADHTATVLTEPNANPLIAFLASAEPRDVILEPPGLDDIFMEFYEDADARTAAS
jgi:nitrite reductase/ring-hydroxylating ferredoxin subunit